MLLTPSGARHASLVALLALLAPVLVLLAASPAQAATPTTLTISLSRTWGIYQDTSGPAIGNDEVVVSGRLTDGVNPLAGQTVTLMRRLYNESAYAPLGTTTTDANGEYRGATPIKGGASYMVSYAGDEGVTYEPSTSPAKSLAAMRDFNARVAKSSGRTYLTGNINPGWGGRNVFLQRKTCAKCSWSTLTSKKATSTGGWTFRVSYPRKVGPTWYYRAVIAKSTGFMKSFSAVLRTYKTYGRGATNAARLG